MTRNLQRWALAGLLIASLAQVLSADEDKVKEAERLVRRGVSRLGRSDNEGALADFNKAIELNPKLGDAYLQRGNMSFAANNYDGALADFTKVVELDPKNVDVLYDRGYSFYALGRNQEALQDYDKYLAAHADSAVGWNRRGLAAEAFGDLDGAVKNYTKAIELDGGKTMTQFSNRASAYKKLGMVKEAIADHSTILQAEPTNVAFLNLRGLCRTYTGDLAGALDDLSKVLQLDPKYTSAWQNRAVVQALMGNAAAAEKDFAEDLKLVPADEADLKSIRENLLTAFKANPNPKTAAEFYALADALYKARYSWQSAIAARRAIALDDFNPDYYYLLGLALKNSGYNDAAVVAFKKAVDADDRHHVALSELGETLRFNLDRNAEAIPYLKKALAVKPDYLYALGSLGSAQRDSGDIKGAIETFNRAVQADPRYAFGLAGRGEAYRRAGEFDKAIADLNQALEIDANSAYNLQIRARARAAKKDFNGALADFAAALKITDGAYTRMYRGLTYLQMNRAADAQADFDAALKSYPRIKAELDQELAKANAGGGRR